VVVTNSDFGLDTHPWSIHRLTCAGRW